MHSNGDIYEGDYKDDRMNEKGKFKWANGAVYEGDYEDDKRSGNPYELDVPSTEEMVRGWHEIVGLPLFIHCDDLWEALAHDFMKR